MLRRLPSQMRKGARSLHGLKSRIGARAESFLEPVHRLELMVPATTSNLGPGFDCMALALDMHNHIVIERADSFSMDIKGEGEWTLSRTEDNLIVKSAAKALSVLGKPLPPLRIVCNNAVPPRRGLGSSSAAVVAGFAAGLALGSKPLQAPATKKLLMNLAAAEEDGDARKRHARVAPCVYGGFQLSFEDEVQWVTQRVEVPKGLQLVLFIPEDEASTARAREILPKGLSYADTIHNISRAAMLVNCFATAQLSPLRFAMEDALHQQHRARLFPHCEPIIEAALKAGAHGAFLSGTGPTVIALTGGDQGIADVGSDTMSQFLAEAVSEEVLEAARRCGVRGSVHIAQPALDGITSAGYDSEGRRMW
eukprot:Transcript_6570.p2 GENE.Transcript_6570~~Transcript_6570.p2  ORF type:complete len:396 (+),score=132.31 Transcript_6570:91-1188(+)